MRRSISQVRLLSIIRVGIAAQAHIPCHELSPGKRIRTTWIDENRDTDELYRMYLGESPVMEMREDGSHRVYLYGDGRQLSTADYDEPDGEPEIHYYLLDHLGSTIAVLDETGQTVWPSANPDGYQTYQPYGEFASDPGAAGYTIPSFTGKFADPGTGNHYFNARYHTSDTGTTKGPMQFSSPDPVYGNLSDPLSWNRYAYCRNNPVNMIDPNGRDAYLVLRPFGDGSNWTGFPFLGHVYLMFDYQEMGEGWQGTLNANAYLGDDGKYHRYDEKGLITFSFHPYSVKNGDGVGNKVSVINTAGAWVDINGRNDINPLLKGDAIFIRLTSNEEEQITLFNNLVESAEINRLSMLSCFNMPYSLMRYNCGHDAKTMVEKSGLTWPIEARFFNLGNGTGGPTDNSLIVNYIYNVTELYWNTSEYLLNSTPPILNSNSIPQTSSTTDYLGRTMYH